MISVVANNDRTSVECKVRIRLANRSIEPNQSKESKVIEVSKMMLVIRMLKMSTTLTLQIIKTK